MGGIIIGAEDKRADPNKITDVPVNTDDPPLKVWNKEEKEERTAQGGSGGPKRSLELEGGLRPIAGNKYPPPL